MDAKAAVKTALSQLDESPDGIARSLRDFQRSARVLSSKQPRLIDEYPDQWVAVTDGKVVAHGKDLSRVLRDVDRGGHRRSDLIVRFIERTRRTLIL